MLKRISIYVLEEQYEELKKMSTSRVKTSEHIRRAIDEYLQNYSRASVEAYAAAHPRKEQGQ